MNAIIALLNKRILLLEIWFIYLPRFTVIFKTFLKADSGHPILPLKLCLQDCKYFLVLLLDRQ